MGKTVGDEGRPKTWIWFDVRWILLIYFWFLGPFVVGVVGDFGLVVRLRRGRGGSHIAVDADGRGWLGF